MCRVPFEVLPFDKERLAYSLQNEYINSIDIQQKPHFSFFLEYLGSETGRSAKTILIEHDYVSQSYVDDFQAHYVAAHEDYSKKCKRVHFFSYDLGSEDLSEKFKKALFNQEKYKSFWDSYLGYIVIRPLPAGLIGASLLGTYPDNGQRVYSVSRDYEINVFGKALFLKTLIYQEQDAIVGACATFALWVAFHKLAQLFRIKIPNPTKVTLSGEISIAAPKRIIPNNDGLDIHQMSKAIQAAGLAPEVKSDSEIFNNSWLKAYLLAYLRAEIPIILGVEFTAGKYKNELHAVTVTGYNNSPNGDAGNPKPPEGCALFRPSKKQEKLRLTAHKTKQVYVHDDQIGPFARMTFKGDNELLTPWWTNDKIDDKVPAKFAALIIPLPEIIKVSFDDVNESTIFMQDWIIKTVFHEFGDDAIREFNIIWDIYLIHSNKYKENILGEPFVTENDTLAILTDSLPRYVWISRMCLDGDPAFELIIDPLEISVSNFVIGVNFLSEPFKALLQEVLGKRIDDYNNLHEYVIAELEHLRHINYLNAFRKALGQEEIIFDKKAGIYTLRSILDKNRDN